MRTAVPTAALFIAALAAMAALSGSGQPGPRDEDPSPFYYGTEGKIALVRSANRIAVKYTAAADKDRQAVIGRLSPYGKVQRLGDQIYSLTLRDAGQMPRVLAAIKEDETVLAASALYTTRDGQDMIVTDEICLEFRKETSEAERANILRSFGASLVPRTKPWEQFFAVVTVPKDRDALDVANKLRESGLVRFAHPNFVARTYPHAHIPNDPYFPMQYYLNSTGQTINDGHVTTADADIDAPEAWDITRGSNAIIVAVIDEGVERQNADIPAARLVIVNGSNFAGGNANDPDAAGDGAHGTCCAGIVAAEQDNLQGVTGVAPLCRIMPVRIPFGFIPSSTYANAINFAWNNGADVLSNSWGYGSSADIPVITAAINNAVTQGRGGIGSVVVWSAGNTADHAGGNPGFVSYPGCVAVADVVTVGASDRTDHQANYSPTGAAVDIVAPSHRAYSSQIAGETFEVWSTDIAGNPGYNTCKNTDGGTMPVVGETLPAAGTNNLDYTGRMGGTSAACPEAAGVAALVLSLNAALTPAQVFDILTEGADKVGGYAYAAGRCNEMGFGRLNAYNAVAAHLWMKDTPADPGTEPNLTGAAMYVSEDVWIRKTADGGLSHEDAEYRASGPPNAVYVRIRNAGSQAGSATIKAYWACPSSGLGWTPPWDGSVTTPAIMGGPIGSMPTGTIPAHGESIVKFDWTPPNPADYAMFGAGMHHFCLLVRIETASAPPYGMTFAETGNLWENVRRNNRIVWKNIQVFDNVSGDAASGLMLIANYSRAVERTRIVFSVPREEKKTPLFRYGDLVVTLPERLMRVWREGRGRSMGFKARGNELTLAAGEAWIGDFDLKPGDIHGLRIRYRARRKPEEVQLKGFAFHLFVQQKVLLKERIPTAARDLWKAKGGVQFEFYYLPRPR